MANERVYQAAAPVATGRGLVASSFQYYLTGDEFLRVEASAPQISNIVVDIGARHWREADRVIQVHRERLVVDQLASVTRADYALDAGALLNLRVSTANAAAVLGRLFVRAQLTVGSGAAASVLGTLLQGYISPANDRAWPGSPIETMHDGLGAEVTPSASVFNPTAAIWIVPAGVRWRVMTGRVVFLTSAVVINRFMAVDVFEPGGLGIWQSADGVAIGPSSGATFSFGAGLGFTNDASLGAAYLQIPADLELAAGSVLQLRSINGQVGDAFAATALYVREWLDQ
jgi:hypothetical protein